MRMLMESLLVMLTRISLVAIPCVLIVRRADGFSQPQIVDHSKRYVKAQYGKTTSLFCTATGSPLPSIIWREKRNIINSRGNNMIVVKNQSSTKVSSRLTINNTRFYESGITYQCQAKNANGSSMSIDIKVKIDGKPLAPENVKSSAVNTKSISIFWDAAEKVGSKIFYYTLYYNANRESQISSINITAKQGKAKYNTILTGLKEQTTYMIYISASNKYGEGERSKATAEKTSRTVLEPPKMSLSIGNAITHQTIKLKLFSSSQNKGNILAYQIFVENIQDNPNGSPLVLPSIYGNHSLNKSKDQLYIAADFNKTLPGYITLGDQEWHGVHFNAKLKPLTLYRIYIRAVGKNYLDEDKVIFGAPNTLKASTIFPTVPKIITIKATTDSLEISWETIESDNVYYKLLVEQGGKFVFEKTIRNVPYKMEGLESGETYTAHLSICIEKKCKIASKSVELKTTSKAGETSAQLLIIIIVVGVVVVLLIVIGAVVYFLRRRNRQKEGYLEDGKTKNNAVPQKKSNKQLKDEELELIDENGTERAEMELIPVRAKEMVSNGDSGSYTALEWECSRKNIKVIRVVENDNFGKICKGSVKNLQDVEHGSVMMRILKDNPSENLKEEFSSMLEIMKRLPAHKGLINLLGCITKQDPLTMIVEYVPYGDLLGYLRASRGLPDEYYKSEMTPINDLKSAELMSFAEQIAAAMSHLERYKIMHCDLSARNILVDRKGLCRLTNFGEYPLVFDKDTFSTKKKGRLLIKWTAIEVVFKKIRTIQSDVWSFGVLLYEIATVGGCPYNGKDERWLLDMLKDDYRMPCPEHVSEALYSVMLDCWQNDPNERPNFEKLVKIMRTLTLMNKHQDHINMTKYDGQMFSKLDDVPC